MCIVRDCDRTEPCKDEADSMMHYDIRFKSQSGTSIAHHQGSHGSSADLMSVGVNMYAGGEHLIILIIHVTSSVVTHQLSDSSGTQQTETRVRADKNANP